MQRTVSRICIELVTILLEILNSRFTESMCIKTNCTPTELHGRMISVEKAKSESESSSRRQPSRTERRPSKERKEESKDEVSYCILH